MLIGDSAVQYYSHAEKDRNDFFSTKWDSKRTLAFALKQALILSPARLYWYGYLARNVPTGSYRASMHCGIVSIVCGTISVPFHCQLLGLEISTAQEEREVAKDYTLLYNLNWLVSQFINFSLVSPKYQILFSSIATVGWNEYLSRFLLKRLKTKEAAISVSKRSTKQCRLYNLRMDVYVRHRSYATS